MHNDPVEPDSSHAEAMHLLSSDGWTEMADRDGAESTKGQTRIETAYTDTDEAQNAESSGQPRAEIDDASPSEEPVVYKVYKIRWFGLMQLVLLNIVVSWDVSTNSLHGRRTTAQWSPTVAFLLPRRQHGSNILLDHAQHHQLAEYRLSLRLRRCITTHDLRTLFRRSTPRLHHRLPPHPQR